MVRFFSLPVVFGATAFASNVLVFKDADIDENLAKYTDGILVEFYAPWCGHCKNLEPEYEKAADALAAEGSKYKLAKVDATEEKTAAQTYGVKGFPTLKWFTGADNIQEYDGPRESKGIVDWIKSITGPAVLEEAPPADATGATITLYGSELPEWFSTVAKKFRKKGKFYYQAGSSKVVIQHPGEAAIESVEIDSAEKFTPWWTANSFPLVGEITGETFQEYVGRTGYGLVWCLYESPEVSKEKIPFMNEISAAVSAADMKYSITWTNTVAFGHVMKSMFGVEKEDYPKIVIQKKAGDKKYFVYGEEMTAAAITDYISKIESGEIKPVLKSEPAPEEPQKADAVKVIVGTTLQEKVFTADKDVLLEVYAPWCGHCKKLEPEYNKLASEIEKAGLSDNVVVAKMDGTVNDSPVDSITWSGFPTIVFIKAGSETVQPYNGERTSDGMFTWLKSNMTPVAASLNTDL